MKSLPLFAVLGTNSPRTNKWVTQIPPNWSLWLNAFRLLIEHGASVHEINFDRSLVHLNITHGAPGLTLGYPEPSALEFFRILYDQCFVDFDIIGNNKWTPVVTAIRRRTECVETLKFLSDTGVDLSRIAANGHCSLHWAAEMAYKVDCIEYLCSTAAIENINRQDVWGWTPLHYAVASIRYGYQDIAFDKVKCLLRNGADPGIKGRKHPIFFVRLPLTEEFTPLQLSLQCNLEMSLPLANEIDKLKTKGCAEKANDIFFDAVEIQL